MEQPFCTCIWDGTGTWLEKTQFSQITRLPQQCPAIPWQSAVNLPLSKMPIRTFSSFLQPQCPSSAWFSADDLILHSLKKRRASECLLSTPKLTSLQHQYVCAVPSPVTDYKLSLGLCSAKLSTWALDLNLPHWGTDRSALSLSHESPVSPSLLEHSFWHTTMLQCFPS